MAAQKEEAAEAPAPKRSMLPFVGIAVGALAIGGGGGFFASGMLGGDEAAAGEAAAEEEAPARGEAAEEGGHGEAKAEAHGEAKAAGGHGEAKAEGGHGAPAEGHGPAKGAAGPSAAAILGDSLVQTLGQFTVNLRGTGGGRVLRMEVQVETSVDEGVVVEAKKAMMRDAVLTLASDYAYADVEGLDGKMRLRDELLGRLNVFLGKSATVRRIYFTEFVVQ